MNADLDHLIGNGNDRQRLMNATWDWHIPTPFSQGWRIGNLVFTGGQLSADEHGNVVGEGDIELQTRNVFISLTQVLEEAGATWDDVIKLNTYYCFNGTGAEVQDFWEKSSFPTRVLLVPACGWPG